MEKFTDGNHYADVLAKFRETHGKVAGNLTTTKRETEKIITEGRLFYRIYPHTLLVFRDEIDYWQTMLLTDGTEEDIALPSDKPYASLVLNVLNKGNAKELLTEKLSSMKIYPVDNYVAYKTDIKKAYVIAKPIVDGMRDGIESEGYQFEFFPLNM